MTARLFLSPPHMSGRECHYIDEAFKLNYIAPAGPMITAFEETFARYVGIPHAVALSSGTAALHLALKGLKLNRGDRIWASTLTFMGSVVAAIHEGLVPTFIDCDEATWTMDTGLLAGALEDASKRGKLPHVVVPTDLYGQSCDLDEIVTICRKFDVPVVCDAAESVGTRYRNRHAGSGAVAAAFSFNGNKIITTSGGGLLASDDKALIDYARYLSTQARQPAPHYEHTEVGFNYRMSGVCAAIGLGQLEILDERVRRRQQIFALYQSLLGSHAGISFMPEASYGVGTRWLTVMLIDPKVHLADREVVRQALEAADVEARPVWKPMHLQPVFQGATAVGGALAERLFAQGLCLPSGTQMTDDDVARVAQLVTKALGLA